ncbi:MAG: transglycosylase [Deltaproteobacteria bacterium]|nr:transglycosylase [Deltaproteobacteria bacterium]
MKLLRNFGLLLLIVAAVLGGCARRTMDRPDTTTAPSERPLADADAGSLEGVDDLDNASLILAIDRSLQFYDGAGRDQTFSLADGQVGADRMKETLLAFRAIVQSGKSLEEKKKSIAEGFYLLRAAGQTGAGDVLFTGYYEPLLEGSPVRTDKYKYPLYRPPPDILTEKISRNETRVGRMEKGRIIPYYTRREIDVEGVLQGRGLELLWVSDPVELNSLHTQGSGKIRFEDGTIVTVGYAQNNGRPFRSVTLNMLAQNKIGKSDSSYRGFKLWLKSRSEKEILEILSHNERYIFFRFLEQEPVGCLGQPVTPGRTIATDPDFFPQGALAFIRLRKPVLDDQYNVVGRVDFSRFVLNQDKGSAIKGPGRVDLFCGFGEEARATAGSLKEKGELYFLLVK